MIEEKAKLIRGLGLFGLIATGVCTVIGGGINVLSVMIQKDVPGIGNLVPVAFLIGALPALLTAICYGILASCMPRAGGGYIYTSRGLNPFVGFMATFSKWFSLAGAVGIIAYVDMFLLADACHYAKFTTIEKFLRSDLGMIGMPLLMVWVFWLINILGVRIYGWAVICLMLLMFTGGLVVIFAGFTNSPQEFAAKLLQKEGIDLQAVMSECKYSVGGLVEIIKAASVLFFAYLGFATISQAGGEAKNPTKYLPLAFVISSLIIIAYYISFSAAIYHTAPWEYISVCAEKGKITAPGIIGILLPTSLAVFVLLMAALALANDIPPMLMAVSRLFFSWAKDGIFPASLAQVNRRFKTPHWALTISAIVASLIIFECHQFGFFLGVDLITIALVFTYILVSFTVITLPYRDRNLDLYKEIVFVKNRICQILVSLFAVITLGTLFITLIIKDVTTPEAWYSKSVYIWLLVMLVGAIIFFIKWDSATVKGINLSKTLKTLPEE